MFENYYGSGDSQNDRWEKSKEISLYNQYWDVFVCELNLVITTAYTEVF